MNIRGNRSFLIGTVFLLLQVLLSAYPLAAQVVNPEPGGWYAGDMHVHRSCGGSPEALSSMYGDMSTNNLYVISLLADMGNGEVQNPITDLPLVNGQDSSVSTPGRIVHWDTEWHWDATYTQYPHQALGGHVVALGLSSAQQIWQEYTYPILNWAHQQGGIAGFAHLQYLDGNFPTTLTCCTPIEYPVEVALGAADFISEDVADSGSVFYDWGASVQIQMNPEVAIKAYYKLLNSGFRPSFVAGTDYPCNESHPLGSLLTYVQPAGGQMTYANWINAIKNGRTVVSRNGHDEFLILTVNGTATPGDEIDLSSAGSVQVSIQWTATQTLTGTIELVNNGVVIASQSASAGPGSPATWSGTVNFPKSGWLAARRMGADGHQVHTAAVFVVVNGAPIRASASDAQYYVDWMNDLIQNTSVGGQWNSFFPTQLSAAQSRYQDAKAVFQQIVEEASGSAPTLNSIALSPANQTVGTGAFQSFTAAGTYSDGTTVNITAQTKWTSSDPAVASVNLRGLTTALNPGTTTISASLGGVTGSTTLAVSMSPLSITTQSLAGGTVGVSYSAALAASGGTLPYSWSIVSGLLPGGLSLNSSTGSIAGTPTTAGTFSFTVQATDTSSPQQTATKYLSIVITSSGGGSCPCTIWPSTSVPGTADSGPDSAVEIGVKFRADTNGYIAGIRFYKGAGNGGAHVGNLWSSAGVLLATATFTGETPTGWQQVNFSSPVAISANATYIASYLAPYGHYADDQGCFASAGVDNSPLHALPDGSDGPNGVYSYGSTSTFPSSGWQSSNYWVDIVFVPRISTTPPTVSSVTPPNNSSGASLAPSVTVTFSEPMTASTINTTTIILLDPSSSRVAATVSYNTATSTATLTPTVELSAFTTYTATVRGGSAGVKDFNGNALVSDYNWSFTTGAAPANTGPGGPILVISSLLNPFSRYYGEILSAEGLNEYTIADMSNLTPANLANYDVVILGDISLSSAQATMLADWVSGGGNLIAMHPDKQLAGLLGLTPTSSTLTDAYLLVQNSSGAGAGIVGQTIQFHGSADLYTPNGAAILATLYSTASTSTAYPAVTLINSGAGLAAAFTYDLARSVIYTRQGNPAWSGEKRDGQIPPTRSDDLYFGAASFDPEPDWVNLSKVSIPQADEQQRLLANLILSMNAARKPLPRFWYFPSGFKAVVIMTGDDHGSFYSGSATSNRFDDDLAASPQGCSVADWQCVRASAYLFPQALASNPLTDSQVAAYIAQGFEVSFHADSNPTCSDWTPSELDSFYTNLLASLAAQFPSLPTPKTHRMHCISWSDYDSQPQVELGHGIRLDTSYYYWPPSWVNDQPGMFTGSGMPMRFTDRNGNIIDVYQATTQMTDESGQSYPFNIDTLLDNALGATGYYGAFAVNAHNDQGSYPGIAPDVISSAQSRGVPIVSSLQMLTWLDGRNSSFFGSLAWSGNTLSFTITQATRARNLRAILPTNGPSGILSSISINGSPVAFATQTIKGVSYGMFDASSGSYQAVYGAGGPPAVVLSSVSLNPASLTGGNPSTGTVTLSGSAPSGGALVTLSSSNPAAATVPSNVTVPAGTSSTTFTITTSPVATTTAAVVSASYAATANATLTINPPVVSSVTLNPTSVTGGSSSTGTVALTGAAPANGATVNLSSSNNTSAQVPSSVLVPAGSTSVTFTVTTAAVATVTTVSVTATYGASVSATLTVNPTVTVSSVSLSPTSVLGGNTSTGTVQLNVTAPAGGAAVALTSSNTAAATVPASVTVPAGSKSTTFTVATVGVPSTSSSVVTATLGVSANATLTVTAATLSSVTGSPGSVVGGNNSTGTVTLNGVAPPQGAVVALSSSNSAAAQVPPTVTISGGSKAATFTITTTPVAASASVTITAIYGVTRTTTLTVNSATLSSLTRSPSSVVGGNNSTGTLTLNGAAPAGGATVTLSSSNTSAAQVPRSVTIGAGSTTATFVITTSGVASSTSVTITAVYGTTKTTTLTVSVASLIALTLNPSTVTGGSSSIGTLTLNGAAPPAGASVSLSSTNTTVARVPATATIPAGTTSVAFTVTTGVVHGTSSRISGTYRSTTRSAVLTVQ